MICFVCSLLLLLLVKGHSLLLLFFLLRFRFCFFFFLGCLFLFCAFFLSPFFRGWNPKAKTQPESFEDRQSRQWTRLQEPTWLEWRQHKSREKGHTIVRHSKNRDRYWVTCGNVPTYSFTRNKLSQKSRGVVNGQQWEERATSWSLRKHSYYNFKISNNVKNVIKFQET